MNNLLCWGKKSMAMHLLYIQCSKIEKQVNIHKLGVPFTVSTRL